MRTSVSSSPPATPEMWAHLSVLILSTEPAKPQVSAVKVAHVIHNLFPQISISGHFTGIMASPVVEPENHGSKKAKEATGKGTETRHHWTQRNAKKVTSGRYNVSPLPTIMSGPSLPSFVFSSSYLRTILRSPWKHNILQLLGKQDSQMKIIQQRNPREAF